MRILFIAKHGEHDNADENAITFALQQLGHTVICIPEYNSDKVFHKIAGCNADVCLFLKWENYSEVKKISEVMPVVFWYFDLVHSDDPTLQKRMEFRRSWFNYMLESCTLGFCTDGDWVKKDKTGKLRILHQGIDERFQGFGTPSLPGVSPKIIFTGTRHHGQKRYEHIEHLEKRYGDKFQVIGDGGPNRRIHKRQLADLFASVRIVVSPDGPCSDLYWSNRVYNTLGLGGFLLHPYCSGLVEQYKEQELYMYMHRDHLDESIDYFMSCNYSRILEYRELGYQRTIAEHTYRDRCEKLVSIIKEVL